MLLIKKANKMLKCIPYKKKITWKSILRKLNTPPNHGFKIKQINLKIKNNIYFIKKHNNVKLCTIIQKHVMTNVWVLIIYSL